MGRNNKQTADYFPHYIGRSRTKFILEQRWHNDGYAFWFKLLELLCAADGQYYDCWTKINWDYLIAVTGVSSETAEEILNTLAGMDKVDKELWETCRVIWIESLMANLKGLYDKRTSAPERPPLTLFPGRKWDNSGITGSEIAESEEKEPETPKTGEEKPKRTRKPSALSAAQLALFEKFYAAYPKKVDRGTAEKAWAKISPPPDEEMTERIVEAVKLSIKFDSRFRERQFTPAPASWLNAKGYMNDFSQGGERNNGENRSDYGADEFAPSGGFRGSGR